MDKGILPVKGTRDFYPEMMQVRTWLAAVIRSVATSFGYEEVEGPYLERISLYAAKSGDEFINEHAFVFKDRGGDLLTLRPELTPTLARMVTQRQNELLFPLRWWSFGPFWRYERPQRGRTREFFQWNVDLIGVTTPEADAELVSICASFFNRIGLGPEKVIIRVNNRKLMESVLDRLDIPLQSRANIYHLIDRKSKMAPVEWHAYALDIGFSESQVEGLTNNLEDINLWKESSELRRFFQAMKAMGFEDSVVFDSGVIRDLDYYTGLVFEAREVGNDEGRTIMGGGRYDNLVSDVGGKTISGVGFGMGDVMVTLLLEKFHLIPSLPAFEKTLLVTLFDETNINGAYSLAAELRKAGFNVICYSEPASLPRQLKYADRIGLRYVIIEGPDEISSGKVTVKDLVGRAQFQLQRQNLIEELFQMLAG